MHSAKALVDSPQKTVTKKRTNNTTSPQFTKKHLKAILDETLDGIITIDDQGSILSYNKACEKIFGYSPQETIGQNVKMLMPEPYHNQHDGYLENYHKTANPKVIGIGREVEGLRKDGSVFPMELAVTEIDIEGQRYYSGIVRDISQRIEAEHALQKAKDFQDMIMNAIPDMIFVKNENLDVITANPAFLSLYPEDIRDQIVGVEGARGYNKSEAERFEHFDREALKKGYSETFETITFPSGITRTLFTKKTRFEDEKSEKYILGISRDVTDMKDAEEEIIRSNTELERFAYIAAHDMQEPVRIITNFASLLKDTCKDQLNEDAKLYLNQCIDGAQRIQTLIEDLLEYSRLGNEAEKPEKVDLNIAYDIACKNLQERIDSTHAHIECADLPVTYGNPVRLTRLMQNLIGNALKYQKEGNRPKITINYQTVKDSYAISIKDNGIGIKNEYLQKIFEPFKRLHGRHEYAGTGIGLAICNRIIENMGGHFKVTSKLDKGSTFTFILPAPSPSPSQKDQ